jgi:hypothetical protein
MKITVQVSIIAGIIFALVCYGVAIKGFMSLDEITDAVMLADARGFAWFYAFLGTIGVAFAAIGVWIVKTHR